MACIKTAMKHLSIWIDGKYTWRLCAFVCVRALIGLCTKQDNYKKMLVLAIASFECEFL